MAASRCKTHGGVGLDRIKPDTLVVYFLSLWWVANLLQATFMDLANDEAYYWYFSQHLDWGYFDHPPMIALLVHLTAWMGGTIGIRLACTMLQPLYLWLFWKVIKPREATLHDALVYSLLCFSQPLLQLYGVLALPDAPLMAATVFLLWAYKRLCDNPNWAHTLLLGAAVALLGYSKYHGALVVALVFLSNPKMLRQWHLWVAGLLGLVLMAPHFWWQYNHDWVSLRYHLLDRNSDGYRLSFTLEYLLLLLVLFNPVWIYHYAKAIVVRSPQRATPLQRALHTLGIGFIVFFLASTLRGNVQPQWLLPVVFPCIELLFNRFRKQKYLTGAGFCMVFLFFTVRVMALANPIGLKGELWHQREQYEAIAQVAGNRPVVFMHTYTAPPKYTFYTGGQAYCTPYYFNRHSQWQYDTSDRALAGKEVILCNFTNKQSHLLPLAMGGGYRQLFYDTIADYRPTRELVATPLSPLGRTLPLTDGKADSTMRMAMDIQVYNPYDWDIYSTDSVPIRITAYYYQRRYMATGSSVTLADTLRAHATTRIHCEFPVPRFATSTYTFGIAIDRAGLRPPDTGPRYKVRVVRNNDSIEIIPQ